MVIKDEPTKNNRILESTFKAIGHSIFFIKNNTIALCLFTFCVALIVLQ